MIFTLMRKGYRMQFIDLAAQQERIRERIEANIAAVLNHGKYIMGPEIQEPGRKIGPICGRKACHVVCFRDRRAAACPDGL